MVVGGEQEATAGFERVRLADELEGAGRIRGEDDAVLVRGVEVAQHRRARSVEQRGCRRRGRVDGVWVAEHRRPEQLEVVGELRLGVEAATGVVEVDLPLGVQASVLRRPEPVETGGVELGMSAEERHERV